MESIIAWLNGNGLLVLIPIALSIFAKTIMSIIRMAIKFKSELVTKEEQTIFEESIRRDIRSYRDELQRSILESCMRTITRELQSISEIKKVSQEMKTESELTKLQLKQINEKYSEIKAMGDTIRQMNSRLTRIEHGDQASLKRTEN